MTRDIPDWRFTCSNLDQALARTSFLQWHHAKPGQANDQWKVTEKIFFTIIKAAITKWVFLKIGVQEILRTIRHCLRSRERFF